MFDRIHVYDFDGVLVDSSHRYRNKPDGTIDIDYWFANRVPEKIAQDKLLPLASQYIADCAIDNIYTIICTSRADFFADREYINNNLAQPNKLIMRPAGNMEPDGPLKRKQLMRLFNLKQFRKLPRFFWEDNKKNIAACADLFTRCFHIQSRICGK